MCRSESWNMNRFHLIYMIGRQNGVDARNWRHYWGVRILEIGSRLVKCFWERRRRDGILRPSIRVIVWMQRDEIVGTGLGDCLKCQTKIVFIYLFIHIAVSCCQKSFIDVSFFGGWGGGSLLHRIFD